VLVRTNRLNREIIDVSPSVVPNIPEDIIVFSLNVGNTINITYNSYVKTFLAAVGVNDK
jgi:hypothetical protein